MQLFHRDRKASSNPKRWSLFIEKPSQTYQQFQDPVSFYAGLQTSDNTAGNRISVLSTISAPAVPRTKNASSNSNSNSKGKSKAKSISKRLSLKLGLNLNLSSHGGGNTPSWWKSSGSQVQDGTSAFEDFYNPNIGVDSFEHIENIYNHSAPSVPRKRSSHFYLQRNSNLRTGVVNKRHSIAVSPSSYNYSEKMAASKRRENTMAEFLMTIDPEDSKSHLTSPSPYFQHQDTSIDAFLHEFSSGSFENPPESDGKRPVSPEGKTRSRPLTPSLDDEFDFRSLNITPEPVLGTSNMGSFQVDSPPPYNSWSTEENTKDESGADAEASTSRPTLTEAENAPQRGLLPWYNDVSGNRASFHSLDELQPPSYPSLGVETPERYTWAGDGKDENIWKRFVGNPEDREAVEILKQAEVEAFRSGHSRRRDGVVFSGRSRSNATDDEEESFVRPRRDTGAWWKGSASQNIGLRHDADEPGPVARDEPGTGQSAAATIAASEPHGEDGEISIEAAPLNIEDILQESITLDTSEEDDDNLGPLYLPSELGSDSPVGVCGICGTDLHYHDGEASENWYMTLKNHFEVAHGNWAARMPDWFGESPPMLEPEPMEVDLDPILEDITELARSVQPEEEDEDLIQSPPEPPHDLDANEETQHECPIPACTESFAVFQDLNLHVFERHGMRGTPLGLSASKTPAGGKPERLQRDKHHSRGFQCPTFACNAWFATYDEREKHASTCHAIPSRPCSAGDSISRDTPEVATEILGKSSNADFETGLGDPFLYRLKRSGDPSQPSLESFKTVDEVKLSEFQQLWRGFSTSIKMDEDIQLGESSSLAYGDLSVFSASSAAGQREVAAARLNKLEKDDKTFGQTMTELLKVVQQTCDSGSSGPKEAFDIQEWLRNNLNFISPETAEALVPSDPTYYENMVGDADTELWSQEGKGELTRVRPGGSKKGKERAIEYQSQAAFGGPEPAIADPKLLEFRSPDAEDASRVKLASMNARFLTAANKAYDKLVAATLRPNASNEFKEFVASLGSVSNIVDVGMDVVDMILAEEVPRSLKMVYCFLHVAYAISQSESLSPEKSNILEFQAGLSVFRSCLPAISDIPGMPSERDIFDEIAFVMWEELEFALKWIETWDGNRALNKVGCTVNEVEGLKDFMRNHCETEEGDGAAGMTIDPKLLCLTDVQASGGRKATLDTLTSWEDAIGCGVFAILVRWLKELKETGVIFAYLCGSLCTSLASSFKKRVKFKDRFALSKSNSQLEFHLQRDVVSHLNSYDYLGVRNVTSSAISLLKRGYISTIREFENHMVNLSRIRRRAQGEFFAFVYAIVWHCNSCATFVPDSLWNACGGPEDDVYSLGYVDQRVRRELCWYSGNRAEEETTVGHVSLPDNIGMPIDELKDVSMGESSPQRTDFCIRTINNLPVPPTPTKVAVHENSPPCSTASSSSPNNYDSLWENSPAGLQGSETSFSNPNSTNITPDELYNPSRANAGSFPTDYFSYGRPQVPASSVVVRRQSATVARESKPSKSKKRKYLEGDGATSFPARRRKVVPTTGKRLYCDVPGCEEFASTSSNLSRHKRTKHGTTATREASYHCENTGCDRVFYGPRGKGNLRTHMRKDHGC